MNNRNSGFFRLAVTPSLAEIIAWTGASAPPAADLTATIHGVAALDEGSAGDLVFLDNPRYVPTLTATRASACLVGSRYADRVPAGTVPLVAADPYRAMAAVVGRMYPDALRPPSFFGATGISPGSFVHPDARLEAGVIVDPGAVIGQGASVGAGTIIGANAVVGPHVRIGRNCSIGAQACVQHALVGDRVIVHPGARIGQDGFGFAMGPGGHLKVPQIGRVIVQNDVEIGANSTIDRGANRDTVIGEGTKIDNLVQIGHNVTIGRHCVIVAHVGISGSTDIGDFVAIGGQVGIAGHLHVGPGAQIAAQSGVMNEVPAGAKWGGSPARPMRDWLRSIVTMEKLSARGAEAGNRGNDRPGAGKAGT